MFHCETGGRNSGLKTSMFPPIGVLPGNAGDEDIVQMLWKHNTSSNRTRYHYYFYDGHDGDTVSNIVMFTEESLSEVEKYNREKRTYVGPDGNLRYPVEYDTISFVCYNLGVFEEDPS